MYSAQAIETIIDFMAAHCCPSVLGFENKLDSGMNCTHDCRKCWRQALQESEVAG